jgi:predicted RNA-binding protein with PUA-like domain
MPKRYWLMKSEPETFSIDDLARVKVEPWTGVRNYLARSHMRSMSVGDEALFHHSNAKPPGVAGRAEIVRVGVVDETQFDPDSPYYDPKATREKPIWDCVEVRFIEKFPHYVDMDRLRSEPPLADMMVLRRGMRLSVQPVTEEEFRRVTELGHTPPGSPAAKSVTKPATKAMSKAPTKPAIKPAAKPPAKPGAKPSAQSPARGAAKPATTRSRGTR